VFDGPSNHDHSIKQRNVQHYFFPKTKQTKTHASKQGRHHGSSLHLLSGVKRRTTVSANCQTKITIIARS